MIVAVEFPDPVGWVGDRVGDALGGVAGAGVDAIVTGLTRWVVDAVIWVIEAVYGFFLDAADPNVQAGWFVGADGPYVLVAEFAAVLLVGFVLAGIVQGVVAGDVGAMLRQVAVQLPVSVFGIVALVGFTHTAVLLVDAVSRGFFARVGPDVADFTAASSVLGSAAGGAPAGAFVVFLVALVAVLAGVVLLAELVIRSALVYLVVALAPLVFAVRVWPAMAGATRKLFELLVALIVSKLVIAVALMVAAAPLANLGADQPELVAPEMEAETTDASVAQTVGVLLASAAAFGVAAFSPMVLMRLLPITEGAMVAAGIRGGPLRSAQQTMAVSHHTQAAMYRHRLGHVATAPIPGAATPAAGAATRTGVATAGAAATGPAAVAVGAGAAAAHVARAAGERAAQHPPERSSDGTQ